MTTRGFWPPSSSCTRRFVTELQDDGVAVDECWGELPDRDRDREVPGCDQPDDSERAAQRVEPLIRHRRRIELADRPPSLAGGESEDGRCAHRLEAGFAERLSHLPRHFPRGLLPAGPHRLCPFSQERGPL